MDVILGTCIIIFVALTYIVAMAGLKGGFFENFDESIPGSATKPSFYIDDTNLWDAIMPLDADVATNPTPAMKNVYFVGQHPQDFERQIQESSNSTKEVLLFPNDNQLNKDYYWLAYKPKMIHRIVLDKVITSFMKVTGLTETNYYIVNSRITHANVSHNNDLLLTIQLILHQESVTFSKVCEFQVLYQHDSKQCYFSNIHILGVIHEQFLSKPGPIVNGKIDFKAI